MTTDETGRRLAGLRQTEKLRELAVRMANGADHLVSRLQGRIARLFGENTSSEFFDELRQEAAKERAEKISKEKVAETSEEASLVAAQLPALLAQVTPVEQSVGSRVIIPYFGIEHFKPEQVAQLFAKGVKPQPFDPKLSYRIRSYAPPEDTILYFVFAKLNKALERYGQKKPVRLLLLQPIQTASGEDVPNVVSGEPITSICISLKDLKKGETPWMEIWPPGPRISEAGVDVAGKQPAVIKIKPPDLDRGLLEPYVEFHHDRRKPRTPVRLGLLLENGYMDGKSDICPLSKRAQNYVDAEKVALLARLPKLEPKDSPRPPVYEPFPVKAQPPPRARRVKATVVPKPEPAALPAPKQEEVSRSRRKKSAPPPIELTATVVSVEVQEGSKVPPITH